MSIQRDNILKRLTNKFTRDPKSVLYQIVNGIGTAFDAVDPGQIELTKQFSVTTATGAGLDRNGADWDVLRRIGELDDTYRARILSQLPVYAQGPIPDALVNAVTPFTGVAPGYSERGQMIFTFPFKFNYDGGLPARWDGVNHRDFSTATFPWMFGSYLPAIPPSGKGTILTRNEVGADHFIIDITMKNPNNVQYQRQDVVKAVKNSKRTVAKIVLHWEDGTTTSVQ
ncbi:hypothetical protein [Desulfosporosinus sp. FKA]|uniref:hypothetical protein n=1 Tax=Desulfosporosinus sp. FKA TaxID=1969834 RepID=UPI000B4A2D79|nr:hypothetical protein [Desulfosporosinus sp. FKA]